MPSYLTAEDRPRQRQWLMDWQERIHHLMWRETEERWSWRR